MASRISVADHRDLYPLTAPLDAPYTTQVPDVILDHHMAHLSGSEFKVLLYIVRHTYGFKKNSDSISLAQICKGITRHDGSVFDEGTGLSTETAVIALKSLEQKRLILVERRTSKEKGNLPTSYALWTTAPPSENLRRGEGENLGSPPIGKPETQQTTVQQTMNKRGATTPRRARTPLGTGRYDPCPACLTAPCECAQT